MADVMSSERLPLCRSYLVSHSVIDFVDQKVCGVQATLVLILISASIQIAECIAFGSSGIIRVTNAGTGVLRGQGGTVYATADLRPTETRLMAQATAVSLRRRDS